MSLTDDELKRFAAALEGAPRSREVEAGETFVVPPVAIHRVLHAGTGPAVTIHAYSPPLTRTGVYRIAADGELQREALPSEKELSAEPAAAMTDSMAA